jgi:hypothetical protein
VYNIDRYYLIKEAGLAQIIDRYFNKLDLPLLASFGGASDIVSTLLKNNLEEL